MNNGLSIPIAAIPIIVCRFSIDKMIVSNGDPSSLMDIIGARGKSAVVNAPMAIERLASITNLVFPQRSKGRSKVITPSTRSERIGVMRIANSPSTTMIMASITLRFISCNSEANLPSNHNSLRRTNAPTKGIASAITNNGTEHNSDKGWSSMKSPKFAGDFCLYFFDIL
jgi:hypothetical protein